MCLLYSGESDAGLERKPQHQLGTQVLSCTVLEGLKCVQLSLSLFSDLGGPWEDRESLVQAGRDIPKVGTALEWTVAQKCWLGNSGAWVKR